MTDSSKVPDVSDQVMAQLAADLKDPVPCQYDEEFLSAYLDGALQLENMDAVLIEHRIQTFEQHLPVCAGCHQALGLLSETIHVYKNFGYTLERQLAHWSVADAVIIRFEAGRKVIALHRYKKPWASIAGMGIAAAMMIFLFSDGIFPTDSPTQMGDRQLAGTIYQSPETYLFSNPFDQDLTSPDVVAVALKE